MSQQLWGSRVLMAAMLMAVSLDRPGVLGQVRRADALAADVHHASQVSPGQQPGADSPELARLRLREGTWDVTMEFTPQPGARTLTASGTQVNRVSLNGLWLISDLEASIGGQPFRGHAVNTYDPQQKRYVGIWIDSTRRYVTQVEGQYDDSGKVLTTRSRERDPRGRMVPSTQITETIDADTERTTLTARDAQGRDFTRMRMTYKRRR